MNNKYEDEKYEDATKYGEFISSYFAWMTLDQQKEKVSELERMTKKRKTRGRRIWVKITQRDSKLCVIGRRLNMNCSNCGKDNATVKFVQIVNGIKTELFLCDDCAEEMGFESINLNLPIDFSSFIGDFFDSYSQDELLSVLTEKNGQKCEKCGLSYEEFVKTGKLGCVNCYDVFKDRVDLITKNIQGSSKHIGRGVDKREDFVGDKNVGKSLEKDNISHKNANGNINSKKSEEEESNKSSNKVKELKEELKKAIKEERYEDAAKIRDEIKKFEA